VRKLKLLLSENTFAIVTPILIFLATFVVFYFTTEDQPTHFNNFVRLADAFLHGRLYLTENIPWLELAIIDGKYYIVPPPLPAILILPFVAIFGLNTNQTLVSILIGSLNASLVFLVVRTMTKQRSVQLWTTAMFVFGTINWWLTASGAVWMFSQVTSLTFLLLAIYYVLKEKGPFLTGIFLGASYWCRLPTILSFPFFIAMYYDRWIPRSTDGTRTRIFKIRPILYLCLGAGVFVFLNFIYNYLRFGTVMDRAYYLIPGVLEEPWYQKGIFDITYIPRHLREIFLGLPNIKSEFPYIYPSISGLAIWITTPAFIYAFFAELRNRISIGCWLSIILISFVEFTHGTWGFSQFGYRFAFDFYPFLLLLTVKGIGDEIRWHHKLLISIGIFVNLWGIICLNKLGLMGY
jgi:hypothetical protein